MDVSVLIEEIRKASGAPDSITDDEIMRRVNYEYKKLWFDLIDLDQNYAKDIWTTPLTQGTNEYSLLRSTSKYELTGGSASAFTLSYGQFNDFTDGQTIYAQFDQDTNVNATINVNGKGAKNIYINSSTQVTNNYLDDQLFVTLVYDSTLDSGNGGFLIDDKTVARAGQLKPEAVYIKYSDNNDYVKAVLRTWDNLDHDLEYYATRRPASNPIVIINNYSLVMYPTPRNTVADGLKLISTLDPYELTSTMQSTDILLPFDMHELLIWGTIPWIYQWRQQADRRQEAEATYLRKKEQKLIDHSTRKTTPVQGYTKDLSSLERGYGYTSERR